MGVCPPTESDGSPVKDPEAPLLDCIVKHMKVVKRKSLHVWRPVNFWLKGGCFLAISFWFALSAPVSPDTPPEAILQGRAVASGRSSSDSQHSLLNVIKSELQHKNPRVHHVAVVELRPFPHLLWTICWLYKLWRSARQHQVSPM